MSMQRSTRTFSPVLQGCCSPGAWLAWCWAWPKKLSWGWVCRRNTIACTHAYSEIRSGSDSPTVVAVTERGDFPCCHRVQFITCCMSGKCTAAPARGEHLFESHCVVLCFIVAFWNPRDWNWFPPRERRNWGHHGSKKPCRKEICEANLVVVLCFSHVFPNFITSEIDSACHEGARKSRFYPTKVKCSFQPSGFNVKSSLTNDVLGLIYLMAIISVAWIARSEEVS